jgi:anti-anti-sigma factor
MTKLIITKTTTPQGVRVVINGEAGISNVDSLEAELQAIAAQNPQLVICDLSKLTYISSAGMEAFLRLRVSLAKHGGVVQLSDLSPAIRDSFHRARLDQMFKFVQSA